MPNGIACPRGVVRPHSPPPDGGRVRRMKTLPTACLGRYLPYQSAGAPRNTQSMTLMMLRRLRNAVDHPITPTGQPVGVASWPMVVLLKTQPDVRFRHVLRSDPLNRVARVSEVGPGKPISRVRHIRACCLGLVSDGPSVVLSQQDALGTGSVTPRTPVRQEV